MSIYESLEYLPIFDPDTTAESPGISAAVGSGIAAVGSPDALGGAGAVVLYCYSASKNAWGYVGVMTGSKISGSQQVRGLGSSCVAFGDTVIIGAQGAPDTPGRVFVLSPPYGAWTYTAIPVIAELAPREPANGDLFGAAVAHCSDGTTDYVAVGAPGSAPPPRGHGERTGPHLSRPRPVEHAVVHFGDPQSPSGRNGDRSVRGQRGDQPFGRRRQPMGRNADTRRRRARCRRRAGGRLRRAHRRSGGVAQPVPVRRGAGTDLPRRG